MSTYNRIAETLWEILLVSKNKEAIARFKDIDAQIISVSENCVITPPFGPSGRAKRGLTPLRDKLIKKRRHMHWRVPPMRLVRNITIDQLVSATEDLTDEETAWMITHVIRTIKDYRTCSDG